MPSSISYSPGKPPSLMLNANKTIGPILSTKSGPLPQAQGTLPVSEAGTAYPQFGLAGYPADAGEVADCLNQIVVRLEAIETLLSANPIYGVTST